MSEAKLSVVFQPGFGGGPRSASFRVETDLPELPALMFSVRARLLSAWEIHVDRESSAIYPIGSSGRQSFQMIARRRGVEGRDSPVHIKASTPLEITRIGPIVSRIRDDGVGEQTRGLEIRIPASTQCGVRRSSLLFEWGDGEKESFPVTWEVRPRLAVSPSGLVLARGDPTREYSFVVQSDGRPFRILRAMSPLIVGPVDPSPSPRTSHSLRLRLDPSRAQTASANDVAILTDHADQAEAILTVLVLGGSKGAMP